MATLLLLALMLTLLLYFVSLVRLESEVSGFRGSTALAEGALNRAVAEALADLDTAYGERPYLTESRALAMVSGGGGGAATNLTEGLEPRDFGWPESYYDLGSGWMRTQGGKAEWTVEGDPKGIHTARAWMAVNLSGLLDPMGVGELDTFELGFVAGSVDPEVFFSAGEFIQAHRDAVRVFVPGNFSRDRGWIETGTWTWRTTVTVGEGADAVEVRMNPMEWAPEQIRAVFAERYPDRDADLLSEAFLDFRDGKEIPTNPDGLTSVPVPMFNELSARMVVENQGGVVTMTHALDIEIWYPFPGNPQTHRYLVEATPELRRRDTDEVIVASQDADDEWEFPPSENPGLGEFTILSLLGDPVVIPYTEGETVSLDWDFGGLELKRADGEPVDRLPAGLRLSYDDVTIPPPGENEEEAATLEVVDPRLNHDLVRWDPDTGPSRGEINAAAIAARAADPLSDGFACWTPAGGDGEWEEGWIGHFPIGEPWRSVDLFGDDGRWWLRHTRPPDWEAGRWTRKRVNPNGWNPDALAAVFADVAPRTYPGQASEVMTREEAAALAGDLAAKVELEEGAVQRGDWTSGLEASLLEQVRARGLDRHAAESVVARTLDRLDAGTQLWGLIALSEVRAADGRVLARRRERLLRWMEAHRTEDHPRRGVFLLRIPLHGK